MFTPTSCTDVTPEGSHEPAVCTGLVIIPTADGPDVSACHCSHCTAGRASGAAKFRARPDVRGDGFTSGMPTFDDDGPF